MGCPAACQIGDNLVFSVTTHDPSTGVVTDADSLPSYRVYEESSTTAILTGSMTKFEDGSNPALTTGFYLASIAVTAANGFESGKNYTIYIEATVGGDTGACSFAFKADSLAQRIAVTCIGNVTGAGTGTEGFTYGGITATVTVDTSGNRTLVFS